MKELSFMQTKQNISIEDIQNIKMLSQLLNAFKKGNKSNTDNNYTNNNDKSDDDIKNNE